MKTLLFFLGASCGIIYMGLTTEPCEPVLTANKEASFIFQSVEKDSLLLNYIYSPTYRLRVRESKKYFDKKFPTEQK